MSVGIAVFLVGLFGVPLVLLAWGRRVRRMEPRPRRAFWGAIVGHCIAAVLAVSLGMIPPEAWTEQETVRGFFGLWGLLLLPIAGGIAGALTTR